MASEERGGVMLPWHVEHLRPHPRGVVYGLGNPGPGPAKMLVMVWPARDLRIVRDLGARLSAGGPPDPEQIQAVFAASHSEQVHDGLEQWR